LEDVNLHVAQPLIQVVDKVASQTGSKVILHGLEEGTSGTSTDMTLTKNNLST
jgi:hypothetical protein